MLSESLRSLPYLVHTNRELGLMLRGVKPLAIFSYIEGQEIGFVMRYLRMFDRHVAAGRFLKRERAHPVPQLPDLVHRTVLYALLGEGWRIDAMIELGDRPGVWSHDRERELGSLLGYEDWQNDIWISRLQSRD